MRFTAFAFLVACGAAPPQAPPRNRVATVAVDERCEMVEAMFRDERFRTFACGDASKTPDGRVLVDVVVKEPLAQECSSRAFAIYRKGQPTNTNAALRIYLGTKDGANWQFTAAFFDPPSSPDDVPGPDGGFDSVDYYCGYIGRLERTESGWRALPL